MPTVSEILSYHNHLLDRGILRYHLLPSDALGIYKGMYIYTPRNISLQHRLPVLYLFRGHEREWVNLYEDSSRTTTVIVDIDWLISNKKLRPLIVVMPGLNSADNTIPSLGINMAGTWPREIFGLGTGRFWDFLTKELFPFVERKFPETQRGLRLAAGFSLGGYTVSNLVTGFLEYFQHAGMYDGTFMWPLHMDPRYGAFPCSDRLWCEMSIFDAALGNPRKKEALSFWNPSDRIITASPNYLKRLQKTQFWIASAAYAPGASNYTRSQMFAYLLEKYHLPVKLKRIPLHPHALHNWHWADRFVLQFLRRILRPKAQKKFSYR